MKRKSIIILIIAVVVLASVVGACVFEMNLYNQTLQFTPQENTVINYNNYAAGNSVDYRNGRFAWSNRMIFWRQGTVLCLDRGKTGGGSLVLTSKAGDGSPSPVSPF